MNQNVTIRDGISIKTVASSPAPAALGDLNVNTGTSNLQFHNGSTASDVATASNTLTLTNKSLDATANTLTNIANSAIASSAAIAYSKLSLTGSIVNADINASAAVAYSKLALSNSIVNADINSAAAITYGKLSLSNSIVNADINASAAVAYSKLALTNSIVNADINSAASIAYSKLALTGAILNADLAGSIAASKLVGTDIATVGTITSGTWSGTTIALNKGGTGQITQQAALNALAPTSPTNGQVISYNGTNWVAATPTAGVKNYLTALTTSNGTNTGNGNFEFGNTTGWSLAHSSLTGGTTPSSAASPGTAFDSTHGGSAAAGTLSLTTVSSGQLSGTYSGSLVSSTNTVAGDLLISSAFNIDSEDQAKVLTCKFYYNVFSGAANFNASGTMANAFNIWIYDVTNAAWIQPAGVYAINQLTGTGVATATFQTTSNSTQYQIALVAIGITGGATTLYLDDFFVGPQTAAMGPAMEDWNNNRSFTLNGGGSPTYNLVTRRVGDSLEIQGTITEGTTTGVTAYLTMPSGLTIDSTKASTARRFGDIKRLTSTVNFDYSVGNTGGTVGQTGTALFSGFYDGSDTTKIFIARFSGTLAYTKENTSTITSNGDVLDFKLTVPISGWSSNTIMSQDTDTRLVAARVNYSGAGTVAGSSQGTVPYANVLYDTHAAFNSGTFTYTVPVSGKYKVTAVMTVTTGSTTSGQSTVLAIVKNGSVDSSIAQCQVRGGSGASTYASGSTTIDCKAGDTLLAQQQNNTGGTNTYNGAVTDNWICFERLSGPAIVQATESVNMRYYSSSSSLSGSLATVTYATKDFDTHNAYASGLYTVPVSGKYQVNSGILISGTFSLNNTTVLEIQKNSSVVTRNKNFAGGVITDATAEVSDIISCIAGDTLRVQVSCSATGPAIVSDNFANYLSISRVGN